MGEAKYVMGQPVGQPNLEKMAAPPRGPRARRHFFQIWLVGGFFFSNVQAGWLSHHIFGFPHPFWGYIIGIGILLDMI